MLPTLKIDSKFLAYFFYVELTELWITIQLDLLELCDETSFKLNVFSSAIVCSVYIDYLLPLITQKY